MGPVSPGVWKSSGTLADGREIIYFDEAPGLGRAEVPDTRPLAPMPGPGGEPDAGLRWDALRGEWVVIAAARQDRTFLPPPGECPLDPSRPGRPTEIPAPDYDVVVFENRFPSLRGAGHWPPDAAAGGADPDFPQRNLTAADPLETGGVPGRQCLRPLRGGLLHLRSQRVVRRPEPEAGPDVVEAWADRTAVLGGMDGIAQVYCFENRGEEIGVTLHHPHGQIYGFPFVTPRTATMLAEARRYAEQNQGNLFDDLVAGEIAAGTRIVARNEHWTAFVPAAARWPFEVQLFPARRVPDIPALDDGERAAFCDIYLDVLHRLDGLFGVALPYIAAWHQAPGQDTFARSEFGLHLQVLSVRRAPGKLKYLAGTESGMGVWINDVLPEEAAQRLREAG